MTSSLVFFSICFFRKRWNSAWRSTFWSRLSRAFSASVDEDERRERDPLVAAQRAAAASAGSFSRTWSTPAQRSTASSARARQPQRERAPRRPRAYGSHRRPFRSSSCRTCRTRRSARSCAGCSSRWDRARAPSCTRRARARTRRSPRARRRGCCGPARCPAPWRSPARSGRPPRARGPSARPRSRRRSASGALPCGSTSVQPDAMTTGRLPRTSATLSHAILAPACGGGYYRKAFRRRGRFRDGIVASACRMKTM